MKKSIFSQGFAVLLFAALVSWAGFSIRDAAAKSGNTPVGDTTDIEAVKQVELDLGNFQISGDFDKFGQLYADDFAIVGSSGNIVNKKKLLSKGFPDKLEWFETGPIDIQVFGNVALGQGVVREKRNEKGKVTNPQLVWADLLEKQVSGWSCALYRGICPTRSKRFPIRALPRRSRNSNRISEMQWWSSI
jgi:ketosteroid isomerase-like protein